MKQSELNFLYKLIKGIPVNGKVVEIGSFLGDKSTSAFGEAILRYRKNAMIYCVDIFEDEPYKIYKSFLKKTQGEKMIDVFKRNTKKYNITIIRKLSVEAAKDFEDESVDLIFIDADHSYEAVKADITAWLSKLKKGAVMCGHDYGKTLVHNFKYGVTRAVREAFKSYFVSPASIWHTIKE